MFKEAALVGAGVLAATGALLWMTPAPAPQAAAVASVPLRGSAEPPALAPSPATDAAVRKAADGHFWAEATANGRHVRFLVDTGATTVALTAADATRLGMNVAELTYDIPVRTASGETRAAAVKLDYVTVAGARVEHVDAVVVREGLSSSLLGMSYLGRLSKFEATQGALIFRP